MKPTTSLLYILMYGAQIYFLAYIYMFPDSIITNQKIFFCFVTTYLAILLLVICFKRDINTSIILLNVALFTFIKSIAQPINGLFLFLDDPYYYYALTLNILYTNSLEPILASWHWLVEFLPYYPMMHLWTATFGMVIGLPHSIGNMRNFTLLISFLSSLIPIVTYLIVKISTKKFRMGLISAVVVAASSGICFYQYQQQYFPILFFVLLILFLVKTNNLNYGILGIIVSFPLAMSHRASNVIMICIFSLYLVLSTILPQAAKILGKYHTKFNFFVFRRYDQKYFLILAMLILTAGNLFVFHTLFIEGLISESYTWFKNPFYEYYYRSDTSPLANVVSPSVSPSGLAESIYSYFSFAKYVIFIISIFGMIYSIINLLNTHEEEIKTSIIYLYCSTSLVAFSAGLAYTMAISRFYIFLTPLVAIFFSYAVIKLYTKSGRAGKTMLLIVILVLSADFIYGIPPALLFDGKYYVEPPLESFYSTGEWIDNCDISDNYWVLAPYTHVIDFFAQKPRSKLHIQDISTIEALSEIPEGTSILVGNLGNTGASIGRSFPTYEITNTKRIEDKFNVVYGNGITTYLL